MHGEGKETPEMEAREHSPAFLKKAARKAGRKGGRKGKGKRGRGRKGGKRGKTSRSGRGRY